ncbi:MAG TPA: S8 family serine peptidase [Gemmatimonadaceae bacterium]
MRQQPSVAAADNANTSFFGGDSLADLDTKPNFSGTSAAAPHAAAIAALVLQANGGPGSVTPAQMKSVLETSAFPHDLDPNFASGRARASDGSTITFTANTDLGLNPSSGVNNLNHLTVNYRGHGSLATLVFNPQGTAATAGNTTGGNNGLDLTNTYFDNVYPGIVFEPNTKPFTVGDQSDIPMGDVSAAFSNQAPLPSVAGQWWTMSLNFSNSSLTNGKTLRFTVGHGPQHNSQVTNGTGPDGGVTSTSFTQADLFGGETLLPEGTTIRQGMTFSGTTSTGGTFSGTINNVVGKGYSKLDGYGFINAQTAVGLALP